MERSIFLANEKEMLAFGHTFAEKLRVGDVVFLQGNLGAGKTTLARGILQGLGCQGLIKSPTYTIVESYAVQGLVIYHFDLYRIHHPQELCDIGLTDYLTENAILLVEWPEKASVLLPPPTLVCRIDTELSGRRITFKAESVRGELFLDK